MHPSPPSTARRVVVAAALLAPLALDPYGADTLALKRLWLALVGLTALGIEALELLLARRTARGVSAPEALLAALALWAALSLGWARNVGIGLTEVVAMLGMLGVARSVRAVVSDESSARRWLGAMILIGLVACAVETTHIFADVGELSASAEKHAAKLFVHNNMAAVYGAMLVPLPFAFFLGAHRLAGRLLWGAALAALLGCLVVFSSRASLGAVLVGMGFVALVVVLRWWRGPIRTPSRRLAIVLGVGIVAAAALPYSSTARGLAKEGFYRSVNLLETVGVSNLKDATFRPHLFRKTIEMVGDAPLRGVGAGNFAVVLPRYDMHKPVKPHAHNDALQVLSELGFVGLVLFLLFLASVGWHLLGALGAPRGTPEATLAVGLSGALVVTLVTGLFEVPFVLGATAANLAVLVGLSGRLVELRAGRERVLRNGRGLAVLTLGVVVLGAAFLALRGPAFVWIQRGEVALRANDRDAAREAFARVSAMRTGSYLPERVLGQLDMLEDRPESALAHFRAARELWPYGVDIMGLEASALLALGRHDEAVVLLRRAVAANPGEREILFRLAEALVAAGRLPEALDMLEYQVQSVWLISMDVVQRLAQLWNRYGQTLAGDEQVRAFVAARHFYAWFLQDGDPTRWESLHREFTHVTHRLQSLPGGPDAWWPVYERFLDERGWELPNTALWTSLDGHGREIFPGWAEAAGPPVPRNMR